VGPHGYNRARHFYTHPHKFSDSLNAGNYDEWYGEINSLLYSLDDGDFAAWMDGLPAKFEKQKEGIDDLGPRVSKALGRRFELGYSPLGDALDITKVRRGGSRVIIANVQSYFSASGDVEYTFWYMRGGKKFSNTTHRSADEIIQKLKENLIKKKEKKGGVEAAEEVELAVELGDALKDAGFDGEFTLIETEHADPYRSIVLEDTNNESIKFKLKRAPNGRLEVFGYGNGFVTRNLVGPGVRSYERVIKAIQKERRKRVEAAAVEGAEGDEPERMERVEIQEKIDKMLLEDYRMEIQKYLDSDKCPIENATFELDLNHFNFNADGTGAELKATVRGTLFGKEFEMEDLIGGDASDDLISDLTRISFMLDFDLERVREYPDTVGELIDMEFSIRGFAAEQVILPLANELVADDEKLKVGIKWDDIVFISRPSSPGFVPINLETFYDDRNGKWACVVSRGRSLRKRRGVDRLEWSNDWQSGLVQVRNSVRELLDEGGPKKRPNGNGRNIERTELGPNSWDTFEDSVMRLAGEVGVRSGKIADILFETKAKLIEGSDSQQFQMSLYVKAVLSDGNIKSLLDSDKDGVMLDQFGNNEDEAILALIDLYEDLKSDSTPKGYIRERLEELMGVNGEGVDEQQEQAPAEVVTIEGKEYNTAATIWISIEGGSISSEVEKLTNLTDLRAYSATEIPGTLVNLTELYADSATEIPGTLVNLTGLSADSATEIPDTLVNLTELYANSATEIPGTLVNLTELYAYSATEIPGTLVNLTGLSADSVTEIPDTLVNLTGLSADSATEIPDTLVNLTELDADSATEIPDTLVNLKVLSADSATEIPGTLVNLTRLYARSATEIPDTLVNLTKLSAYAAKEIPGTLVNLTGLSADSATEIPGTLVNLTELYADSATEIPGTLVNLTELSAGSATEIPGTLVNLTDLRAYSATEIPGTLVNLTKLSAGSATEIPGTLTSLTELYADSATEIPGTLTNLTKLYADSATEIPDTLTSLIDLDAYVVTEIPDTLTKLVRLEVYAATEIPDTLVNLKVLTAHAATEIPDTLVSLTNLSAYAVTEIPDTLVNLTRLYADSATEIPKELVNLENLRTKANFDVNDFPNLKQTFDYSKEEWVDVER
jgi:hypothetical protein